MSNTTILDLPVATSLDGTEVLPIVQPPNSTAGVSKRVTVAQVAALASSGTGSTAPFLMATSAFTALFPGSRYLVTDPDLASSDGGSGAAFTIGPVATAAITYAKFQQVPPRSVLGVAGNATAVIAPITGTTAGHALVVNAGGTGIGFGAISTAAFSGTIWTVPFGGTGDTSIAAFTLLIGNGTNAVATSNIGAAGQLLVGQTTTSNPAFTTIVGDVGFSASGTATIATAAVTYAKFQQVPPQSVLGVAGNATGVISSIAGSTASYVLQVNAAGTGLTFGALATASFSGSIWPVPQGGTGDSALTAFAVLLGNGTAAVATSNVASAGQLFIGQTTTSNPAWTSIVGDIAFSSAGTATIATAAVTYAKFQQIAGLSVHGVTGTATAVSGAITGTANQFLQVNAGATALIFATMTGDISLSGQTATIATASVTFAKFQQVTGLSVVGITGTATGVTAAITGTANQVLVVNPGGTALAFGQVNLSSTSSVTGILGLANGGTNDTGSPWTNFTSTITASSGTFTSVAGSLRYKQLGKTVWYTINIVITTVGSATGVLLGTLPFTAANQTVNYFGIGYAAGVGKQTNGNVVPNATTVNILAYDVSSVTGTGTVYMSGTYESA